MVNNLLAEIASKIAEKHLEILQITIVTRVCLPYCLIHNQHAVAVAFLSAKKSNWLKNVARCDVTRFDLATVKCPIRFSLIQGHEGLSRLKNKKTKKKPTTSNKRLTRVRQFC